MQDRGLRPPPPFAAKRSTVVNPQIPPNFIAVKSQGLPSSSSLTNQLSSSISSSSSSNEENSLREKLRTLEVELRTQSTVLFETRASYSKEQQRNSLLASELARVEVERLSWKKDLDESRSETNSLKEELSLLQLKLNEAENEAISQLKIAEQARLEKEAALTTKEDLASQLRVAKAKLIDYEDELYKAEEDMAALRAELREQQNSTENFGHSGYSNIPEQIKSMEQERDLAKADLKNLELEVQREIIKRREENERASFLEKEIEELVKEREDLRKELKLLSQSQSSTENKVDSDISTEVITKNKEQILSKTPEISQENEENIKKLEENNRSVKENEKLALQVRQLLAAVEKLDSSREKLLAEVDSQSIQIEHLFTENVGLSAAVKELATISAAWEAQAQMLLNERMKQGENKGYDLETLNTQSQVVESISIENETKLPETSDSVTVPPVTSLQGELLSARAEKEDLKSQLYSLSLEHTRTVQEVVRLKRMYKHVLGSIENRLKVVKQETAPPAHSNFS